MLCGMAKIAAEEAQRRMAELPAWRLDGDTVTRQFTFEGFPAAIAFVVRLGFAAESVDHHPDLLINYKRVTVSYSTHSEGGLTQKDFDGAKTAAAIAAAAGGK
jgi:4a-hydroxytetrahydrobiopterin dehydratase